MDGLDQIVGLFFLLAWFVYGVYKGLKKIKGGGLVALNNLGKALSQKSQEEDDSDFNMAHKKDEDVTPSPPHFEAEPEDIHPPVLQTTLPVKCNSAATRPIQKLQQAIIWAEILAPPVSLRKQ